MNKLSTRRVALILSLAALAAAGCGSSSSSKSAVATPSTPSTASTAAPAGGFSAQLNTLCKQANAASKSKTTLNEKVSVIESYIPKLEALKPPAAQKADYDKFLASVKSELTAVKAKDSAGFKKANADVKTAGAKLGAPACA